MLEYVVRPFQSPWPGSTVVPSTPRDTREKATITWGAKANIGNDTVSGTGVNVNCCYEQYREAHRDYNVTRVTAQGPGGPTAIPEPTTYVSYIARPTQVILQKDKQKTCGGDDWMQMSGVAQGIEGAFADLEKDLHLGSTDDPGPCKVIWKLNT